MKLLFDLLATQSAFKGAEGGGEYSRSVFRRLAARDREQRVAGYFDPDYPLDPDIAELVAQQEVETIPVRNKRELQAVLASGRFASFMSGRPYNCHSLDFSGMEVFFAVHGLRPLEQRMPWHGRHYTRGLPQLGKWLSKYFLELVRPDWRRHQFQGLLDVHCRQLHVIVPSWHTRYSMIEKLRMPEQAQIHEFYCPETKVCAIAEPDRSVLGRLGVEPGRYLFMVSGNRWIKNAWRGLRALIEVMDQMPDNQWLPVVITGGVPRGLPRGRRNYVIPAGNLSAQELAAMYEGARAFYYPTMNEGFGYPPLEAMAQGTPVICSAITSVTEIVGDAGIYFNPFSTDEIKIRLRLAVEDDALLLEHSARGQRRLAEVRERQERDLNSLCDLLLASMGN